MNHLGCQDCPNQVPIVSARVARLIVEALPVPLFARVKIKSFEWLTTKHPGLTLYEGIHGRWYTDLEKDVIALEAENVRGTGCPYQQDGRCLIIEYLPSQCADVNGDNLGWMPTFLARELDKRLLLDLVAARAVADAKVAGVTRRTHFP